MTLKEAHEMIIIKDDPDYVPIQEHGLAPPEPYKPAALTKHKDSEA